MGSVGRAGNSAARLDVAETRATLCAGVAVQAVLALAIVLAVRAVRAGVPAAAVLHKLKIFEPAPIPSYPTISLLLVARLEPPCPTAKLHS